MRYKLLLISSIAVLAFLGSFVLKANAATNSISVDIVPPNPNPNESTTITLNSYLNNLDSIQISWSVNGKTASSGIGKKSFSTTAPAAGAETNIVATITLPDGVVDTRITLRSSVTVLLWQANDSYVPPFYKGKAWPTLDSEIKVVAMPEIRTSSGMVNPDNMTYAWKKDYTNEVAGSGYGKRFFTFVNDYLENSSTISVTASTLDQRYSGEANVTIGVREPKVIFYRNDSMMGTLWDKALYDHAIQSEEILEATPYFASPKETLNPTLVWKWFINDSPVSLSGFRKNLMPLKVEEGTHGTSRLRLEIENRSKIWEKISKEINIEF